ncbi:FecR family protein [Echinicola salinicaeni]|uniref:FecR family protein n=1 Tax=Echinicola salinicaeni TaxID=2762757 RepID=UPI001646C2A7|nr:FecR domain-containing protein [Echinicola salinicaeni]
MMTRKNEHIPKYIEESIRKLLRGGGIEAEELERLNNWYDSQMEQGLEIDSILTKEELRELMLSNIHRHLERADGHGADLNVNHKVTREKNEETIFRRLAKSTLVRAAAILLILIGTVVVLSLDRQADTVAVSQEQWTVHANPKGQKSKMKLPDGSTVILNADSEVRYVSDFGQNSRDIFLKGQAFFEVEKDSIPFRVMSAGVVTEALGTSFDIKSFEGQAPLVRLTTGRVKVYQQEKNDTQVILEPGEEVRIIAGALTAVENFDIEKAIGWQKGIIVFDRVTFSEVFEVLERWYNVEIDIENLPNAGKLVSGEFKKAMLVNVLESLSYSYGFDYQVYKDKNKVNVQFKKP